MRSLSSQKTSRDHPACCLIFLSFYEFAKILQFRARLKVIQENVTHTSTNTMSAFQVFQFTPVRLVASKLLFSHEGIPLSSLEFSSGKSHHFDTTRQPHISLYFISTNRAGTQTLRFQATPHSCSHPKHPQFLSQLLCSLYAQCTCITNQPHMNVEMRTLRV